MSRRKPDKPTLLGPDGKPYVAPKPAPKIEAGGVDISESVKDYTITFGHAASDGFVESVIGRYFSSGTAKPSRATEQLSSAVARQVGALTADFEGEGGEEMPKPPADLHTYADAYESARRNCKHPSPESTTYGKGEFYCPDCRRYFGLDEYRRTRESGWMFGGY